MSSKMTNNDAYAGIIKEALDELLPSKIAEHLASQGFENHLEATTNLKVAAAIKEKEEKLDKSLKISGAITGLFIFAFFVYQLNEASSLKHEIRQTSLDAQQSYIELVEQRRKVEATIPNLVVQIEVLEKQLNDVCRQNSNDDFETCKRVVDIEKKLSSLEKSLDSITDQ